MINLMINFILTREVFFDWNFILFLLLYEPILIIKLFHVFLNFCGSKLALGQIAYKSVHTME